MEDVILSEDGPTSNFIDLFVDYTKDYESPTTFWKWAAYATIAATLRNNVYFEHKLGKIFPNVYVVLLADSAEYRKGAPINLASDLLAKLNHTKVIKGRNTVQYIIDRLSMDVGNKKSGVPIKGGSCILLAEELAAYFVEDKALIPMITDIYDYKEEYTNGLRGVGDITVKNLCVNLLAGSNETFLREVYDARATYGGLLRRTFFIKPDKSRPAASFFNLAAIAKSDPTQLIASLNKVKQLQGGISATVQAVEIYNEWYLKIYDLYKTNPDRSGVLQSMHTSVLKLAIILAASSYTLEITRNMMQDAIAEITSLRNNYETYAVGTGKYEYAQFGAVILDWLWRAKDNEITRSEILVKYWHEIPADELDKLMSTFEQSGFIRVQASVNAGGITYKATEKLINQYKKAAGNGHL